MNNGESTTKLVSITSLAAALLLAGCGGAANQQAASSDELETVQMVAWAGPEGEAMQSVVDKYNAEQGPADGVEVQAVTLSREDIFNKEAVEMASQTTTFDIYYTSSYVLAQHGPHLAPLEGIDTEIYPDVASEAMSYEGDLVALPLDLSTLVLYYRQDLFDEIDPEVYASVAQEVVGQPLEPTDPNEWSFDDFKAAAAYFSREFNPDSPTQYGITLPAKTSAFQAMMWNSFLWSAGGSWTDDNGDFAINTPEAEQAVALYAEMYENGSASPSSAQGDFPELQSSMTSGNVAMIVQWTSGYAGLNDEDDAPETAGNIEMAYIPGEHQSHLHVQGIGINKYSERQEATKKFIDYLTTVDAMEEYAKAGVPVALTEIMESNASEPVYDMVNQLMDGRSFVYPVFDGVTGLQINTVLATELAPAWLGERPPAEALQAAQDAVERQLNP